MAPRKSKVAEIVVEEADDEYDDDDDAIVEDSDDDEEDEDRPDDEADADDADEEAESEEADDAEKVKLAEADTQPVAADEPHEQGPDDGVEGYYMGDFTSMATPFHSHELVDGMLYCPECIAHITK